MSLPLLFILFAGQTAAETVVGVEPGLVVETWASDPMLVDPVAFCIDEQGRIFVAETARQERGVEDTRSQPYWNLDDISLQSVEDRLAMYRKWAHKRPNGMEHYTDFEDRIRLLVDEDGDGVADTATVYSGGYDDPLDGTGSGLLAHEGTVYYTNIPHLWMLRDVDGDGIAEEREAVLSGFGVRIALRGHDMHGLTWGPDGRLYWSIGDRGYNVVNQEGVRIKDPTSGAVFRCEPDGSNLEVFHTGLRNPQELAFDDFGVLFTGDNNSDAADKARLVHVAEGGETGWRMEYQTLEGDNVRGPWVQEGIWKTRHEHRPAWALPPIAHVGNGPSGLVHYPGLGLDDRYDDHFFLCNFSGTPVHSQVKSFSVQPDGAGYRVDDVHDFVSNVLCTDVDFGYDGRMYISDWVEGWEQAGNGRILTVHDPRHVDDPAILEAGRVIAEGFDELDRSTLVRLLGHEDQRIRLRSQFEIADRGSTTSESLQQVAMLDERRLARIHAIWALGMQARSVDDPTAILDPLMPLLQDADPEIRGQTARILGEARMKSAGAALVDLIFDPEPRVVYHATMAVGRMGYIDGLDAVTEMIWSNDNEDLLLRHAGVMALTWFDDRDALLELSRDEFPAVRLAVLLALRRMHDPAVGVFLRDPDPLIAAEAARAINDIPIEEAMPGLVDQLAMFQPDASTAFINTAPEPERIAILRRSLNAALRRGRPEDMAAVAEVALYDANPPSMRHEAVAILSEWIEPSVRDRVNGAFRPVEEGARDSDALNAVLERTLPRLVGDEDVDLAAAARELASDRSIPLDDEVTWAILEDADASTRERIACMRHLQSSPRDGIKAIRTGLDSGEPRLRGAALELLVELDPNQALEEIRADLEGGSIEERQHSITAIGSIDLEPAHHLLLDLVGQVQTGALPVELHVDVMEAARLREGESMEFMLLLANNEENRYESAWKGGDVARGRDLVLYHAGAACIRCHAIDGHGGVSGPELSMVASRLDRRQLLESIIHPGAEIAEGYGDVTAMPEMTDHLDPRQVRDIVEYLSTLR
tara:strand:+ start:4761 stop:7886 length:3126 start_codon:yes stop_codon:yes gene_type:complete